MGSLTVFVLIISVIVSSSGKSVLSQQSYGITGGVPADISEYPHNVFIAFNNSQSICGGSIISRRHILTTAHCVRRVNQMNEVSVVVGTDDLTIGGVRHQITQMIPHPKYDEKARGDKDIAIMRLEKKITFSRKAKVIKCATTNLYLKDGTELIVTGWGMISNGTYVNNLRAVGVPKVSRESCREDYAGNEVTDAMFCAGIVGKDSCKGDSGGPLILRRKSGDVLFGITSWGDSRKCGMDGRPGVYTKVSKFYKWIKKMIKEWP